MTDHSAELAAPVAYDATPASAPALRACLFVLGGSLFAVNVTSAREVAVFDGFTRVPRAPAWLLGVANLRGAVMPIVDIRPLLHLPAHRAGAIIKGLVIEDASIRAAVAIEAALGLESFDRVVSPATWSPFSLGSLPRGDEAATLLDAPAVLEALMTELHGTTAVSSAVNPEVPHGEEAQR